MRELLSLKERLGIPEADRSKDALLSELISGAERFARDFCRSGVDSSVIVEMAAHDYGAIGAEGVAKRSVSGLSETYLPSYPERIMAVLRRHRRMGVPD